MNEQDKAELDSKDDQIADLRGLLARERIRTLDQQIEAGNRTSKLLAAYREYYTILDIVNDHYNDVPEIAALRDRIAELEEAEP